MSDAPFACDMSALTKEQRAEHSVVTAEVFGAVESIEPAPGGYDFVLRGGSEVLERVARFVSLERLCCPFFHFTTHVPAGSGAVTLRITGPRGVEPFIEAEFASSLPPTARFPD